MTGDGKEWSHQNVPEQQIPPEDGSINPKLTRIRSIDEKWFSPRCLHHGLDVKRDGALVEESWVCRHNESFLPGVRHRQGILLLAWLLRRR